VSTLLCECIPAQDCDQEIARAYLYGSSQVLHLPRSPLQAVLNTDQTLAEKS